jgi:hypothetical protein
MSRTSSKNGSAIAGRSTAKPQDIRYADSYGVEVEGFDAIESSVFMGELVLIMKHFEAEMAADNYFED